MTKIPDSHRDIFDKRSFAHIATVNEEGMPQVTPVWVEYDGEHVLINSAKGRKKDRNLRARIAIQRRTVDTRGAAVQILGGYRMQKMIRVGSEKSERVGMGASDWRAVDGGQRARRAGERSGAGLHDVCPRWRLLWVAVQLLRAARGYAGEAATSRSRCPGARARLRAGAAHRLAGTRSLERDDAA